MTLTAMINGHPVTPPYGIALVVTGSGRTTAYWTREDGNPGRHRIVASVAEGATVEILEDDRLKLVHVQQRLERLVRLQ